MLGDLRFEEKDEYSVAIRDPLWGHIYLSQGLAALSAVPAFRKLERILQLGPAAMVYPGATHSRAAHSYGVYHLARRLIHVLADRGATSWTSPVGVRSFLVAALLHDLGHFPYAHSLKDLALEDHEALTGALILADPLKSLIGAAGADPFLAAAIVDQSLPIGASVEAEFYRRLLSGVLDPDKLDYLNRDARYCGVPYGSQDVDFIYSRLLPMRERGVVIDSRGIANIESILFAKYLMYRTVYWHRDVRAATAIVKKAIKTALNDGALSPEALYGLDDAGLFTLLSNIGGKNAESALTVRYGRPFVCIWETAFDPQKPSHRKLEDLDARFALEAELFSAFKVSAHEFVIDVPEHISFETGLYIHDEDRLFEDSSTVFSSSTLNAFTSTLRVIRCFVAPEKAEKALIGLPFLERRLS